MGWMDFLAKSGPLRPDLNNVKPCMEKRSRAGGLSDWGSDWGPWVHGWGTWLYGTWMRPNDAIVGLFGVLWTTTT